MNRILSAASTLALAAGALAGPAAAEGFNRIASFATPDNMAEGEDQARETSAEILDATGDGMTLVYTDSPLGVVGLVDITDPAAPKPLGNVEMGGEPTSVTIVGTTAYIGVNTSESYTDPSGKLVVLDVPTKEILATCDLGGQPDSLAKAKDGSFIAVAIENERDEDAGDGRVPQMPAGWVSLVKVSEGGADCDGIIRADVTSLADIAGEDPEPEYVDINSLGETVVTLQENNWLVVLDKDGKVVNSFSAGTVDLTGIDTLDNGALSFDGEQMARKREPDAVQWLDDDHFAIANEGDMDGGSRGWTIFHKDGTEVYESGPSLEQAIVRIGHYPDKRSDAKGVEPESVEFAKFGDTPIAFIGTERASVVGVYDVTDPAAPALMQLLPSGMGPEGYVAIPERGLLVSANETDLTEDGGARAHVMLFQWQDGAVAYPTITSDGADDLIGWGALSGLAADPDQPGTLYAVSDSFYGKQPRIFTIDTAQTPARITSAVTVTRDGDPAQKLDLEGIAADGKGGFWLASEGRTDRLIPHALYHVTAEGEIEDEVGLPPELAANEIRFGFEGVTKVGDTLWMAVQREWKDDPKGMVKLVAYNTESGDWGAVHYPLGKAEQGWVGLSEITAMGDWVYIVERDNQIGAAAKIKKLYRVSMEQMQPAALGGELPVVSKEEVHDFLPDLASFGGYVVDKVEGFAIDAEGTGWVVTDNDGVDDSSGETFFWSIGPVEGEM